MRCTFELWIYWSKVLNNWLLDNLYLFLCPMVAGCCYLGTLWSRSLAAQTLGWLLWGWWCTLRSPWTPARLHCCQTLPGRSPQQYGCHPHSPWENRNQSHRFRQLMGNLLHKLPVLLSVFDHFDVMKMNAHGTFKRYPYISASMVVHWFNFVVVRMIIEFSIDYPVTDCICHTTDFCMYAKIILPIQHNIIQMLSNILKVTRMY